MCVEEDLFSRSSYLVHELIPFMNPKYINSMGKRIPEDILIYWSTVYQSLASFNTQDKGIDMELKSPR